jgi:hypothetical protein
LRHFAGAEKDGKEMSGNNRGSGRERVGEALATRAALMCAFTGLAWALWLVVEPLAWRHFPNILKMFLGAWLYLLIMGVVARSGFVAAAKRPGAVVETLFILGSGLVWRHTLSLQFVPFNASRHLMAYGLAGLVAHCLRRGRGLLRPKPIHIPDPERTGN